MSIVFKTFRTFSHPYVYDRHTNAVVMLSEDEYAELVAVEKGELLTENSEIIKKYQSCGLFQKNIVEKIEHSGTEHLEPYLKNRMKQLTLQVTQQCNLRCEYCVYSGIYKGQRIHSNKRMDISTAKNAIDYFMKHSTELSMVVIGFYGGEPLLEFNLIKECVEYAKNQAEGRTLVFNMTTNGTLLNDEVVDYLVENDFHISISLDGSKEEHDRSRKFKDGSGTFDCIIKNIERIRSRFPEFDKQIQIMTTINPHMDVGCVVEYFTSSDVLNDKTIMFNTMNTVGVNDIDKYDDDYYCIRNFEYIKLLFALVGKIDKSYISPLVQKSWSDIYQTYKQVREHGRIAVQMHHNGPCIPGVRKLFVSTDGNLYPCERINEEQSYYCIGNLENGIDLDKANQILNIGKLSENACINCWALRHCSICAAQLSFDEMPNEHCKLCKCGELKRKVMFMFKEICVLNEFGFTDEMRG